jgi:hypothetical protein
LQLIYSAFAVRSCRGYPKSPGASGAEFHRRPARTAAAMSVIGGQASHVRRFGWLERDTAAVDPEFVPRPQRNRKPVM